MTVASNGQPVIVVHDAIAGRVRLRVPALRRNERLRARLAELFDQHDDVEITSANLLTATILVRYGRDGSLSTIVGRITSMVLDAAPTSDPRGLWQVEAPEPLRRQQAPNGSLTNDAPESYWHVRDPAYTVAELRSDANAGLDQNEALARLRANGANALSVTPPPTPWELVRQQLDGLPTMLLIASSAVSLLTGGLADAVVILAVVGLNAGIGVATERKAARVISALTSNGAPAAIVVRDGVARPVAAGDVVVGDLLVLSRGTWVAADARLLAVDDLAVDESVLTGESVPATKSVLPVERVDVPLGDRHCMLYRGTLVTSGGGRAVVVATGDATEAGRIQQLIQKAVAPRTPLQQQLEQLGRQLVGVAGTAAAATLVAGVMRGQPLVAIVRATIALAVAAVPEGLPTVSTTTLAAGLRALRRRGVLFRRLDAVETMGAIQVLCLDKTGTITTSRMQVAGVMVGDNHAPAPNDMSLLLETVVLCSEATVQTVDASTVFDGSATETAMLSFAMDNGIDVETLRAEYPTLRMDHRADTRMFMVTRHSTPDGDHLIAVKGRPDVVLGRSRWWMKDGREVLLTDDDRANIDAVNERMSGAAWRVLGVARRRLHADNIDGEAELVWLGLIALEDPIRPGMRELVSTLRRAGIRTMMITGDQSGTALAVARSLGLAEDGEIEILDSTRLDKVDPEVLAGLVQRVHVVSRVNPAHKLRIVRALQASGLVVAMTGDGINDGPALRGADVGIAIGRGGTEVAREVADAVLQSDDVPAILHAIARGRTLRADIRKAVHFITATNLSELAFMLTSTAAGCGLPLNPKQLLWINLVTDVFPELALDVEPPDDDVLSHPPDDPRRPLVSRADYGRIAVETGIMTTATLGSFLYGMARYSLGPRASTLAFNTLLAAQLLHSISARSDHHSIFDRGSLGPNRYIGYAVGGGLSLQVIAELAGGLRRALGTEPLPLADILVGMSFAGTSFLAIEGVKHARIHRGGDS